MKYQLRVLSASLVAALGLVAATPFALADTAPLVATCSTSVSNNVATWNASSTGGVAPYTFLWTGDASVNNQTAGQINATYGTNGTYVGTLRVTDASSTVATATCQAVVNFFATTTPPTPTPTTTPVVTHTHINDNPTLDIGGKGQINATGMVVQSIGSGSFTASVWGVTYTVTPPSSFSMTNLAVNDQIDLTGTIASTSPSALSAKTLHDRSVIVTNKHKDDDGDKDNNGDHGNGKQQWTYHFTATGTGTNDHIDLSGTFFGNLFAHFNSIFHKKGK